MSKINPKVDEYETPDSLSIAKDIAWVIKTLWGGAVVFILATAWVVALAQDVKNNTDKIDDAATQEHLDTVIGLLERIEKKIDKSDDRQRQMKSSIDKLETQVEDIKKRGE
jgi:septal ring factor EnvC (AmiA/AmiB activator)